MDALMKDKTNILRSYRNLVNRCRKPPNNTRINPGDIDAVVKYLHSLMDLNEYLSSQLMVEQEKRGCLRSAFRESTYTEDIDKQYLVNLNADLNRLVDKWKARAMFFEQQLQMVPPTPQPRYMSVIQFPNVSVQVKPSKKLTMSSTEQTVLFRPKFCSVCKRH